MTPARTLATARRVLLQLRHDPRTLGMLLVLPVVIMGLLAWILSDADFDFWAPPLLGIFPMLVMFLVTSVATLRERTSGIIEMYRVAPVNAWEVLVGKLLAYLFVGGLIAVTTVALLRLGFGVPMLGDPRLLAGTLVLLLLASLGLGLAIAVVSDSERQAVQLSLLVLLASVFFSGFVLDIDEFTPPVRALAYALPVTHGIQLLRLDRQHHHPGSFNGLTIMSRRPNTILLLERFTSLGSRAGGGNRFWLN